MSRNPPLLFVSKLTVFFSLSIGISKFSHVSSRRNALNELETVIKAASDGEDIEPVTKDLIAVWRGKLAVDSLRDCICETSDDARALVNMAAAYGVQFFSSKFVINPPFLSREI